MAGKLQAGLNKWNNKELTQAVRDVVLELGPTSSINRIARTCIEKGIPVNKPLIATIRKDVRKTFQALPLSKIVELGEASKVVAAVKAKVDGAQTEEELAALDAELAPAATFARTMLDQVRTQPPLKFPSHEDHVREMVEAEQERERKRRAEQAREERRAVVVAEKEAKWAAERAAQEASKRLEEERALAATQPGYIVAETADVAEAVGQRFEAKMNGEASLPELPEDLLPGRLKNNAGHSVRRRWLEDLLLQKPSLNSLDAAAALQATFGLGLDNIVILETLKAARELHGLKYRALPRAPTIDITPVPVVPALPKPIDPNAPRLLEYLDGGEVRYVTTNVGNMQGTLERLIEAHGHDFTYQVWKPSKTKTKVTVQISEED